MSPSKKFLLFWLALILGMILASRFDLPTSIILWLTGMWLLVFISGQEERIEILSLAFFATGVGFLIWQKSGGESWLNFGFITSIGNHLVNFRDSLIDKIFLALPEPHGSLMAGILFGNRLKLSQDLIENFRTVGLSHIIAVSGQNLSIIAIYAQTFLRGYLGQKAAWVSMGLIVLFVIITGAPSSVLRAAVMASTLLIAQMLGRPSRAVNILIFAAGLLAIFEPKIIFDIGFQLSIAATYGLLRLTPLFQLSLRKLPVPKMFIDVIAQTLGATIMTAPILVLYFERLSVVSPLTNILVVPLIPMLMALGFIAALVLLIYQPLGRLVALLSWPILQWIISVGDWFGRLPNASTNVTLPSWSVILLIVTLIGGVEILNIQAKAKHEEALQELAMGLGRA